MTKRNLSELLKFEGTIYIYLKDSIICKRFYSQAENWPVLRFYSLLV